VKVWLSRLTQAFFNNNECLSNINNSIIL